MPDWIYQSVCKCTPHKMGVAPIWKIYSARLQVEQINKYKHLGLQESCRAVGPRKSGRGDKAGNGSGYWPCSEGKAQPNQLFWLLTHAQFFSWSMIFPAWGIQDCLTFEGISLPVPELRGIYIYRNPWYICIYILLLLLLLLYNHHLNQFGSPNWESINISSVIHFSSIKPYAYCARRCFPYKKKDGHRVSEVWQDRWPEGAAGSAPGRRSVWGLTSTLVLLFVPCCHEQYPCWLVIMKDYNVDKAKGNHPQFYLKGGWFIIALLTLLCTWFTGVYEIL